ncbi:hypothetical protein [Streptomyces millisiae]|uniref:Uncharacterized protein n=1 Tax=Streptomyces millisiae TaxID=3075542 RepID=A0ABU2LH95_9ACTN|nr:hypothetical protein [Streptomyces sp. DSM 44918]MDT0316956.1 hypothetical protein [Streptomyces sp. DSM 44918]
MSGFSIPAKSRDQEIRILPYLSPAWQAADIVFDVAMIAVGVSEVRSGLSALNATVKGIRGYDAVQGAATAGGLLRIVGLATQVLWGGLVTSGGHIEEAAKKVYEWVWEQSIKIDFQQTELVHSDGKLGLINRLNPSGVADAVGTRPMRLMVMTKDHRSVEIETGMDESWIVYNNIVCRAEYGHTEKPDVAAGFREWPPIGPDKTTVTISWEHPEKKIAMINSLKFPQEASGSLPDAAATGDKINFFYLYSGSAYREVHLEAETQFSRYVVQTLTEGQARDVFPGLDDVKKITSAITLHGHVANREYIFFTDQGYSWIRLNGNEGYSLVRKGKLSEWDFPAGFEPGASAEHVKLGTETWWTVLLVGRSDNKILELKFSAEAQKPGDVSVKDTGQFAKTGSKHFKGLAAINCNPHAILDFENGRWVGMTPENYVFTQGDDRIF